MNFNRKGDAVQILHAFYRSFYTSLHIRKVIIELVVYDVSIDLLNCFLSDQDKDDEWLYNKVSLHVKEQAWCLRIPLLRQR
jgi:hypothetical protein